MIRSIVKELLWSKRWASNIAFCISA